MNTVRSLPIHCVLFAFVLAWTTGCNPDTTPKANTNPVPGEHTKSDANSASPMSHDEHGHKNGQHGGTIVSLGRDSYHVEAVVAADGLIRLYTLGQDETRVIDVESQPLKGFVKAEGSGDAQEIVFDASPQTGDAPNRTSLFVGKLPTEFSGRSLEVTIPNMRIEGERFRLGFQTGGAQQAAQHAADTGMPSKVTSAEEKNLYLQPGGVYTTEDIAANGNMTASQKFKGIKSSHDMHPQPGDIVCPISGTKANPKFTWIIGGKPYQFCCPPCLDEYLTKAKSSTEPLPDPSTFVKQ